MNLSNTRQDSTLRRRFSTLFCFAVVALLSGVFSVENARGAGPFADLMNESAEPNGAAFDASSPSGLAPSRLAQKPYQGIWRSLGSTGSLSDADAESRATNLFDDSFDYVSASSAFIVRGQIQPPVVSPSTAMTYGPPTYTYETATEGAVNPPATMEDPTTLKKVFKYQQDCSKTFLYIPRTNNGLGVIEGGGGLYFAFPCEAFRNSSINGGVFRLTPTFNYTGFQTPKSTTITPDIPNNVFDAGVATSFSISVHDLEGTVEVQAGIASEFEKIKGDAFYLRGRAEASLPVDDDRTTRLLGGVAYYNRLDYKLVPIAGVVWKPNANNEIRFVFPDPRWGHFIIRKNETDWWFFVSGDIGGGKWLMTDHNHKINGDPTYCFDYNDYRVTTGVVFDCSKGLKGSLEVGGAFGREIVTKEGTVYKPKSSVLLKAGLFF
ncbi:MAG: hypothetical protein PHO46_00775 [Thermoguttaceae bacterium]|jgi:hypothetical protein|nr:hypothetical protein [Thermoguttaceae bacterium]